MESFHRKIFAIMSLFLFLAPIVVAESTIDDVLEPVTKVKDLLIAGLSLLGIIVMLVAGGKFFLAGENIQAREAAKATFTYAVIGLMVVWGGPPLVGYLTAPVA